MFKIQKLSKTRYPSRKSYPTLKNAVGQCLNGKETSKLQWSSFLMSVSKKDSTHCKLEEFHKSECGISFDSWRKMFQSCKERYPDDHFGEILDTPVHVSLFKQLAQRASLLGSGYFAGKSGESSLIFYGNSGIGKSSTLRNFTQSCQIFHPNVIPIYLSYENLVGNPALKQTNPIELVFKELENVHSLQKRKNKESEKYKLDKLFELSNLLETNGKHLMLIVDNIEELYRQEKKDFPKAIDHLSWLSIMSSDSSGRISVILSVSSNSLPSLFKSDDLYKHLFPLLNETPSLSCTRFLQMKLPTINPVKFKQVSENWKCSTNKAKEIIFLTGGKPREVSKLMLMNECEISYLKEQHIADSPYDKSLVKFHNKVTKKMKENNESFFESICSDNRPFLARLFIWSLEDSLELDMNKVGKANLDEFIPLKMSEAQRIWSSVNPNSNGFKRDLEHLHDCGCLVVDGEDIYPPSLFSLYRFSP